MIFGREQLNIEREVLLWTNPNPTSAFSAQTLNVDLSGYDFVKIKYAVQIQNLSLEHCIQFAYFKLDDLPKEIDAVNGNVCLGGLLANYGFIRAIAYDNRSLKFGSGYGNQTVNQNWNVPFEIYGIKGRRLPVTFHTDEELLWTNSNPSGVMEAISLNVNINDYRYTRIVYTGYQGNFENEIIFDNIRLKNEGYCALGLTTTDQGSSRLIYCNNGNLSTGNCYWHRGVDNYGCVPKKIYGIGRKQ